MKYGYESFAEWGIFIVWSKVHSVWPYWLQESNGTNYNKSIGVRAVVVLSPDITVNEKGDIYKIEK